MQLGSVGPPDADGSSRKAQQRPLRTGASMVAGVMKKYWGASMGTRR